MIKNQSKLINILNELFQINKSDLDFKIYQIKS
jgi:hypothetical protein